MHHLALIALLAATAAVPAAAQTTAEFTTGLDYQEGKFGTDQRIKTISVSTALQLRNGRASFGVNLSWKQIEGPGNAIGGGGLLGLPIIIDPTRPAQRSTRQGLGDLYLTAGYTLPPESPAGFSLTLSSEVKLPTASRRKGLGTGKTDLGFGAELATRIGRVTPFAAVSYTLPSDPKGFDLRSSIAGRIGGAINLSDMISAHLAYGYAQSISRFVPDEQQIGAGLRAALNEKFSLGLHGAAGLSEGSPDLGAGLSLGVKL